MCLARALQHNGSLTYLNLAVNGIGNQGAESLARLLQANGSLTSLSLSNNGIGDAGAASLACALQHNNGLISTLALDPRVRPRALCAARLPRVPGCMDGAEADATADGSATLILVCLVHAGVPAPPCTV